MIFIIRQKIIIFDIIVPVKTTLTNLLSLYHIIVAGFEVIFDAIVNHCSIATMKKTNLTSCRERERERERSGKRFTSLGQTTTIPLPTFLSKFNILVGYVKERCKPVRHLYSDNILVQLSDTSNINLLSFLLCFCYLLFVVILARRINCFVVQFITM
jgi:hypothetical protein